MSPSKQDKLLVSCPHCGQRQSEPRAAISTICKKCGGHFLVQEALKPRSKTIETAPERRRVNCFNCGTELEVAISAESTMCKRCSSYVDLKDYRIASAVSKNFRTKGSFVVEPKGYVFNTEAVVGEAVIRGRFHGKLVVEGSLTIYSTAEIKGSFVAGHLIIPAENHFFWNEPLRPDSAEIGGELAANLNTAGTAILKSTARLFGNLEATNLVVEAGAVVVGRMRIGVP
jgi:cytoskeletal protein CcmA (bactofilin family)